MEEMTIRSASMNDLRALDALRRAEQEAVGFIPISRYEREITTRRPTLLVAEEGGEVIAFAFWTAGWPVAHIQQVVVRRDARRVERATALVKAIEGAVVELGRVGLTCRCRRDLEAVAFWDALGFTRVRMEEAGRRGVPLVRPFTERETEVSVGGRRHLHVESNRMGDERDRGRGPCEVASCPCGRYRPGEDVSPDLSGAPAPPRLR